MSAISAVIHWDGRPVERALLESVNNCVRYRCPDGAWIWVNGSVGMAQADLATLPEDEPGIPIVSGKLRIAASCRIDNRDELLRALPWEFLPKSGTDAALVLSAYQAWGEACVDRLIGDFAFIIWDDHRRSIFAARDISGARQLYYYCGKETLFIASEYTQILQDPTVPLDVDEEQLLEYFTPTYQWHNGWNQGLFCGFQALSAGYILYAEQGNLTVRPFWQWNDYVSDRRSEKQVIEEYLHALEEAVRCRLRSRSPVAIELSGGLDSPAIASLAARLSKGSNTIIHTLSDVFDEFPEVDERQRIHKVLEQYPPLLPHFIVADSLYLRQFISSDWFPRSIVHPHEIWMPCAKLSSDHIAAQEGCRVVLTGELGDTLNGFSGNIYFDLIRRGNFSEALRRFRIGWKYSRKQTFKILFSGLLPMVTPLPLLRACLLAQEKRRDISYKLPEYFTSSLKKRLRKVDEKIRIQRLMQSKVCCPAVRKTLTDILPPTIGATMLSSQPIETRHPYYDRRLIEMVLSMPQELKREYKEEGVYGIDRFHHREAMVGILPDELRIGSFGLDYSPVFRHCLSAAAIYEWLMDYPVVHIFERGYVLPDLFLKEIEKATGSNEDDYFDVLLCVEAWLRSLDPGGKMSRLIPPRRAPP